MTFIREKEIPIGSGNYYHYEVKSVREGKQVRQIFVKYLGIVKHDQTKQVNLKTSRESIYKRDIGICWVCGKPTEIDDWDLGHIIDRCNGGSNEYNNVVVMHHKCNIKKPKHHTYQDALDWRYAKYNIRASKKDMDIFSTNSHINKLKRLL